MTLGQHIQELRKSAGLSQEALGEQLTVSRQAVSKWESDATMPDIDNLIAMSRLFGVSIGSLLQIEDDDTTPIPEELTERELNAVEAIVSRYLEASEQKKPTHSRKWTIAVAFVLAFGVISFVVGVWARFDSMNNSINQLQDNINQVNSSVSSQVNSIAGQVESLLTKQAALVSDWSYDIASVDVNQKNFMLNMSFALKTYTENTQVTLVTLDMDTDISYSLDIQQGDNGLCVAAQMLPLSDNIKLTVILEEDGVKQTQVLETLSGLASSTRLNIWPYFSNSFSGNRFSGAVEIYIGSKAFSNLLNFFPLTGEIRFLSDDEVLLTVPVDFSSLDNDDFCDARIFVPVDQTFDTDENATITAILYVTDALGQTYEAPVCFY